MSRSRGRTRTLLLLLAGASLLASCTPVLQEDLPNGDHVVTTYSRLNGIKGTVLDNDEVALATCPGGYLLLNETFGKDSEGLYRRWEYGCLER